MHMYVYGARKDKYHSIFGTAPICVESNLEWAIPYWTARKKINPALHWVIK